MRILFPDIDECAVSFPCQNNGTCVNNNGSYVCECTDGYMGRHCKEGNPLWYRVTSLWLLQKLLQYIIYLIYHVCSLVNNK